MLENITQLKYHLGIVIEHLYRPVEMRQCKLNHFVCDTTEMCNGQRERERENII